MAGSDEGDRNRKGFREGLESSHGDPRVLVAINAVLSAAFAWLLVWGADLVGAAAMTLPNVAIVAVGVFVLTHVVTRP
ncbi:hypothetical protein [Halobiforma nitratireducens]|uniref:DUF8107 domain-containing protein n=1 Tax=Halobiforma nitratireducens JCM 10879 TaxID=1227454 RepID=M0LTG1_9EURY|nr:hypothetical protein [Halobiforma nitratireducens]EMA35395.1 hypothetical protein C446_12399 [Halobiforma nitratireducens JCM 10879]